MNSDNNKTEAAAVAEIARDGMQPAFFNNASVSAPYIVWPKSQKVDSLEQLLDRPLRKRSLVVLRDCTSFITYVDMHKEPGSTAVYASVDAGGGSFTAVLDGNAFGHGAGTARWGDHLCRYECVHTDEWKRWTGTNGKALSQLDMAQFIEDNMIDIVAPAAADMLEVVKTLEATQGATFKSLVRLENGNRGIAYERTTGAKAGQSGEMEIPARFAINVPVFENGPQYRVECRFRYNINDGVLRMGYDMVRPHKVVELELLETRNAITTALQPYVIPVFLGNVQCVAPF